MHTLRIGSLIGLICLCLYVMFSIGNKKETENFVKAVEDSPLKRSENKDLIDLNSASESELEKLPGIGKELAFRIVEHRKKFGRFRRAEDVILVKGMSEKKYRKISHLITAKPAD